jgi:hypothetical protein
MLSVIDPPFQFDCLIPSCQFNYTIFSPAFNSLPWNQQFQIWGKTQSNPNPSHRFHGFAQIGFLKNPRKFAAKVFRFGIAAPGIFRLT